MTSQPEPQPDPSSPEGRPAGTAGTAGTAGATAGARAEPSPGTPVARPVLDEALEEMTRWPPQDRAGAFRIWHRGALSLVHLNVLAVLEAEGPLPMSRLAEALDVSDASATGIVDRLERRGFLERRHALDDRRVVLVHPTDAGADVFRVMSAGCRERLSRILTELSDQELAGLVQGLRALHAARERLTERERAAGAGACPTGAETTTEALSETRTKGTPAR